MKNPSIALLATAALITLHSTPSWSEPTLQTTQSGSQEEIIRLEKNINKNYRDIKSINDLGVVQLKLGHYDKAITQFQKALEIDPPYTLGPLFSGNIYTDAEVYQDKIKEFQSLLHLRHGKVGDQNGNFPLPDNFFCTVGICCQQGGKDVSVPGQMIFYHAKENRIIINN